MELISIENLADIEVVQELLLNGEYIALGSDKYKAFFAHTLEGIANFRALGKHSLADHLSEHHCRNLTTFPFRYVLKNKP